MMKIINIPDTAFYHNGTHYTVGTTMYGSFIAFQVELDKMETAGYNYCYLYSATNCDSNNEIITDGETPILFIEARFLK